MSVSSNEVPFIVIDDEDPFIPRVGLEIEVYDGSDPTRLLDVLPDHWGGAALDEIAKPGGGAFSVWKHDPKLDDDPDLLAYRNIIKIRDRHRAVGAFLIQSKDAEFVAKNGISNESIRITGEGLRAWFRDAVVVPFGGLKPKSPDQRTFSFASERGAWYKPDQWVPPIKIQKHNLDPNPGTWGTAPAQWPDAPSAWWVWGVHNNNTNPAPAGYNYFRYEFTVSALTGAGNYSVFAAGDNRIRVYIDGQQIIETEDDDSWTQTHRADFELDPGPHVLAIRVENVKVSPAALIAALFRAGDAAQEIPAQLITTTGSAGWLVNAYPDPAPGWTAGEIVLTLMAEASARGVHFPSYLTPTFTTEVDSKGLPWSRALDWNFALGTEYYEVIERLEEAVCDLWIDPETLDLHMYGRRGTDRSTQSAAQTPVIFRIGHNVAKAAEAGKSDIKNTLMLNTLEGWSLTADGQSASIPKYGRIEGSLSTGLSRTVSGDVAEAVFRMRALPSISQTFDFIDSDDAEPFIDFGVGDTVLVPTPDGSDLQPSRVMSLSVAEDTKTGRSVYAAEFGSITDDVAQRHERWLRAISGNSLGGTVTNAGGGGGSTANGSGAGSVQRGPQGLQGPVGPRGMTFRGVWSDVVNYDAFDAVSHAGSSWISTTSGNLDSEPVEANPDWELISKRGEKGDPGADGAQGPPGSIAPRMTSSVVTTSLETGASWTGTISLGPGYRLYRIQTSIAARVRLYASVAQRTADAARPVGTDPTGDHGLMFEYVTTPTLLAAGMSPLVDGAVLDFAGLLTDEVPISVTNAAAESATVTVTLTYARTE